MPCKDCEAETGSQMLQHVREQKQASSQGVNSLRLTRQDSDCVDMDIAADAEDVTHAQLVQVG